MRLHDRYHLQARALLAVDFSGSNVLVGMTDQAPFSLALGDV
jgi:hypothetical protein